MMSGYVAVGPLRLANSDGTEFLDAVSGTFNLPLGYRHPTVVAAVVAQLGRHSHLSSHLEDPARHELATKLISYAPLAIKAAWIRDLTGSTANECAVRIAQRATGRSETMSLFLSHHGQTIFTTAMAGNSLRRKGFPVTTIAGTKIPAPYCHRCFYRANYPGCELLCAERIADFIEYASSGSVAALIVEPVLGNGGNIVPPVGYFPRLQAICRRYGVLVIADEVQTGMGRTGTMFACEQLGLQPDIITLAKGLSGIGVPAGAVLMRSDLDVLLPYEHSFTSGANPLSIAAANATVDIIGADGFLAEVRRKGRLLGEMLHALVGDIGWVSDIRGLGLMWGIEVVDVHGAPDPATTRKIVEVAQSRHRLILRSSSYGFGNVVKIRPALVASESDLEEICDRLRTTLINVSRTVAAPA